VQPSTTTQQIEPFAPYSRSVLPNGLRLLTAPMPSTRSVSVAFYIGAGSRYENDEEAGASHYLEHMLFKGTQRRTTPKEISETIERVGGYMNASTDREMTVYWARVARPHLNLAVDLLSDMLLNSTLTPEEIEKERTVILEELHTVNDVPSQRAFVLADAVLWPDQPLGRDVAGTPESVNGINRDMLTGYLKEQYDPGNTVLAIAGQVTHAEVEDLVSRYLSAWPHGSPRNWFPVKEVLQANRCVVEYRRTEQAHICLSFPGLSATDPDRYALDLLSALLGEGMASRLFLELRERHGLVYEVSSSVMRLRDCGSIGIYAGTDPRRGLEAVQAVLRELERVVDDMTESELERARELVKGRLLLRLEDTRGLSGWLGAQELLLDHVSTPEEVVAELEALTLDHLRAVGRRVLRPDQYRLVVVGPYRSDKRFRSLIERGL
jgi:predicted Zn-dependent peptidase